jgi:hypothetical protein
MYQGLRTEPGPCSAEVGSPLCRIHLTSGSWDYAATEKFDKLTALEISGNKP